MISRSSTNGDVLEHDNKNCAPTGDPMTTSNRQHRPFRILFMIALLTSWSHTLMAAEPREERKMNFAFVLLAEPRMPTAETIMKEFPAFAEKDQQLKYENPKTPEPGKETLAFDLDQCGLAFVALMHSPIPDSEADEAARFSFSAIYSGWTLPRHKAHLLVTLLPIPQSMPAVKRLSCMTALLAAVSKATGAVGIYWGDAGATHDPTTFQSMAQRSQLAARLSLWTGVSMVRERGGRLSLLSLGMDRQLNLPDLLLTAPEKMGKEEVLGMFFDSLSYVTQRGEPLPDGDTIGRENGERVTVRYVPSPIDKNKQVWRIELK
jgi:hypothetical protein